MKNVNLNAKYDADLDELLGEIALLLLEDPSDTTAAAALVDLVDKNIIGADVARYLYSAAVQLVYFSEGRG